MFKSVNIPIWQHLRLGIFRWKGGKKVPLKDPLEGKKISFTCPLLWVSWITLGTAQVCLSNLECTGNVNSGPVGLVWVLILLF